MRRFSDVSRYGRKMQERWKTCLLDEQAHQLLSAVVQTLAICRIHNPYERVRLLEVVLPVCAKGLLATNIP